MVDLFTYQSYPDRPGFKAAGTSRDSARAAASKAPTVRDQILALLRQANATPDEAAAALHVSILTARPRFSELSRMRLIFRTGERRRNASGLQADVWRAG